MADSTADQQRSVAYYFQKIRMGEASKWDKDELLDVIYWWRQILGLALGLLWGMGQITGLLGFMSFITINILLTIAMYKTLLGIDEEDYGGHSDLLAEGMPGSVPSFLLAWVLTYTALHT